MRSLLKLLLRVKRCSSGSASVEAALIMPVAISLMIGVVDFAWGFQTWATANKSVRDAARYLGGLTPPIGGIGATSPCPSWAVTYAQNLAVYGKINGSNGGSNPPLVPGWQVSGGSNNNVSVDCTNPPIIAVTAKVPYNPLILAAFIPLAGTVTLSVQHTEESVGD
jgi:TadE-like protein